MERARCNTELYSLINNPSNFLGSLHLSQFFNKGVIFYALTIIKRVCVEILDKQVVLL